jgi:hypothetical protein
MAATLQLLLSPMQCLTLDLPPGSVGYLEWYDLDAGIQGWAGSAKITTDPALAIRWPTRMDALLAWKEQSTKHPVRPYDGQPNCPLTAYSAEIIDIDTID